MTTGGPNVQRISGRGRTAGVVGLFVLVVLVALVLVGRSDSSERLDPNSHDEQGTSALVALLRELGAQVTLDVRIDELGGDEPALDSFDVVVVLRDVMDDEVRSGELRPWVRDGGTLVVADPQSPLVPLHNQISSAELDDDSTSPGAPASGRYIDLERRFQDQPEIVNRNVCTIGALDGLEIGGLLVEGRAFSYPVAPDYESCFGSERDAFIVAKSRGQGVELSLGSAGVLTNEALANQPSRDNAVLLTALIGPVDGTNVAVLDASPQLVPGEETLWDLVPLGVKLAGAQLLLAFVVFALWRARRLGKPVTERQPVTVASSDLVAAVGGLLERGGSSQHAADVLRADLRRDLVARLGLARDLPAEVLFQVVAGQLGLEPGQLQLALGPGPVGTDQELLAVMRTIDVVRKEAFDSVRTGS